MNPFGRSLAATFLVALFSVLPVVAESTTPSGKLSLKLTQGYRNHNLDWNIAGSTVNVLSELTWHDLHMYETRGEVGYTTTAFSRIPLLFDLDMGVGWVVEGEGQDSDYLGNNRTSEFSRSFSSADGSHTLDLSLGVGPVYEPSSRFRLIPKVGYYVHHTGIDITDGVQVISSPPQMTPLGPFSGLNSTYDAFWHGPFVGLQCDFGLSEAWSVSLEGTVYYADYYAEANWNLRTDFAHPSFEHEADGFGYRVAAEFEKKLAVKGLKKDTQAGFVFGLVYEQGETDSGTDRTFFAIGTQTVQHLNEVNWSSFSAYFAFRVQF